MKKTIKLISIILIIVMCLTLCPHQAFAAESTSEVTADGGTAETPVVLNVAPAIFSVTIPTGLPVDVDANGNVETATDAKIVNNSHGPVKVVDMTIEAVDGWTIANYDKDLRNEKFDSNQIGMVINNCQTTGKNAIAFVASNFNTMLAASDNDTDECAITYSAKVTPLSEAVMATTIANVVFTVDWDAVKLDAFLSVVTPESKNSNTPTLSFEPNYNVTGYAYDSDGVKDLTIEYNVSRTFEITSMNPMAAVYVIQGAFSDAEYEELAGAEAIINHADGSTSTFTIDSCSPQSNGIKTDIWYQPHDRHAQYGDTISINSKTEVVIPNDEIESSGYWETNISLITNCTTLIVVTMTDIFGNEFREARYVTYDTSSPKLTILTPESSESSNPTYVVDTTCTVSGTVFDDNGIKSLTVNGEDVEVSEDGSWSAGLTLIEGETLSVTVAATDNANITTSETRYVNLDTISPSIEVVYPTGETPSDATEVNNSLGVVKGTVTDNSGIKSLTVNGENVAMDSDGTWSTTISLEESVVTEVKAIAVDNSGKESESVKYVVYYDKTAPDLKVSNPYSTDLDNPNYADSESYIVSGSVSDESGIKSLTVNGENVNVEADGSWSMNIALNEEEITAVSIVATDNKGNVSSTVRYVCYSNVEAYALILDNSADSSNAVPMIFVQEKVAPTEGSVYNSETYGELTVTKVYSGIETTYWSFWYGEKVPWTYSGATSVVVEDVISPISTEQWFWEFDNCSYINLKLLDTSSVTNMRMMFCDVARDITSFEAVGLEQWDVSKVTNMDTLFGYSGDSAVNADPICITSWSVGDLSNWDVSNVTNMSSMFCKAGKWDPNWSVGDLSNWDVSNVTSMGMMFEDAGYSNKIWSVGDISKWDVSNVTSMIQMFSNAGYNAKYILDLSGWDVSNVTSYTRFNYGVTSKIIAPNFG